MIKGKREIIFISDRISILLVRFIKGRREADRLENEFKDPARLRRNGIYSIAGGLLLLIAAILLGYSAILLIST